jgi:hypothetical protein
MGVNYWQQRMEALAIPMLYSGAATDLVKVVGGKQVSAR